MKTIAVHTLLSLFSQGGSITSNMSTQIKYALKNGALNKPTKWYLNGYVNFYAGGSEYRTNVPGPVIDLTYHGSNLVIYINGSLDKPETFTNMSSGDTFRITEIKLMHMSGGTPVHYASYPVDTTVSYGTNFKIQHTFSFDTGFGTDAGSSAAVAFAFATGYCSYIQGMKYTVVGDSTQYTASDFSWGSGSSEYSAYGETPHLAVSPQFLFMVDGSGNTFAERTLGGTFDPGSRVNLAFHMTAS